MNVKNKRVWMKVSQDELSLPLCIADTAKELAKMCNTTEGTICSLASRGKRKQYPKYVCVWLEEGDDE